MADPAMMSVLEEAIKQYQPAGAFAETRAGQLEQKRLKTTAGMRGALVGRGLSGTTVAASIPAAFEQEVAQPFETETEMLRSARLMEALMAKAGFMEREAARKTASEQEAERLALERERMKLQEKMASQSAAAKVAAARRGGGGDGGGAGGGGGGRGGSFFSPAYSMAAYTARSEARRGGGGSPGESTISAFGTSPGVKSGEEFIEPGSRDVARGYTDVKGRYHAPAGYGTGGSYIL